MPRLPFEPEHENQPPLFDKGGMEPRAARKSQPANGEEARPITVSQLADLVKNALAAVFPDSVRVVGEVSNFSSRTHWFFSLKDDKATIRCVMFASNCRKVGFPVRNGLQVVVRGRLDFYDAQGNLQLYADRLEPIGQGALELAFRALCEELRKLGYFEESRKKRLPLLPRKVAVVTSRTGAALQDVINTAQRRWAGCQLFLLDVRVQGAAAAPEIAAAIKALSREGPTIGIDAIILTRGGGSIEDLWAFNERAVADAIYRCPLPIVAAIGHETDLTIAEMVADARAATPTQAAMLVIPDSAALSAQVNQLSRRMALLVSRQLTQDRHRLHGLARQPVFRRPMVLVDAARERLTQQRQRLGMSLRGRAEAAKHAMETLPARLTPALPRLLQSMHTTVESLGRHLESVGPANVLKRGYTYTLGADGRVLRTAKAAAQGDRLTTVLHDGKVLSRVESGSAAPPTPRRPRSRPAPDEPGLFNEAR